MRATEMNGMLVLSRRPGERIKIADNIYITVIRIDDRGHVKLGIQAPTDIPVLRTELCPGEDPKRTE